MIAAMAVVSVFGGMYVLPGDSGIGIWDTVVYADNKIDMKVLPPEVKKSLEYKGEPLDVLKYPTFINKGNNDPDALLYYIDKSATLDPKQITGWTDYNSAKVYGPGTFYVYYMVVGNENYNDYYCKTPVPVTVAGEIVANTIDYVHPSHKEMSYNGEPQALCEAIQVNEPSSEAVVEYKLADTVWSSSVPTAQNVGEYTVYYRITADGYTTVEGSITAEIKRVYTLHEAVTPVDMDNPGHQAYWTDENGTYYTKDGEEYTETHQYVSDIIGFVEFQEHYENDTGYESERCESRRGK